MDRLLAQMPGGWLLSILVLLIAPATYAQPEADAEPTGIQKPSFIRLSANMGPTFGWIGTIDFRELAGEAPGDLLREDEYPVQLGYQFGMALHLRRGWLRARTGVGIANAGALFNGSSFLNEDDLRISFITLRGEGELGIPLKLAHLYIFAGPTFRYRLNVGDAAQDFKELERHLHRLSASGSVGTGLLFDFLGVSAGPELRYSFDLTGLSDGTLTLREQAVQIVDDFRYNSVELGLVIGF